ncbi:MAG: hypothetical protein E7258_06245 [Lachnospiraceae bacterium]|nr:hypothetical protein [Lachnospiraceae bacterium]
MRNKKLFRLLLVMGIMCSTVFVFGSQVFDYGDYATLEGRYYNGIASVYVTNTSNIPRYITASVKGNGSVISSTGHNTSASGGMVAIEGVSAAAYNTVYGHATIYNSSAPASGYVEYLEKRIK